MAFEDRSSPSAATDDAAKSPSSPESSRTSPYTCTTIPQGASPKGDFFRITSFALSSPRASPSPPPPQPEPVIQTLKYSIRNILKPEFGKSAVLRTRTGPKIPFKPYDLETTEDVKPFSTAPLGSLRQAVSQIGTRSPEPQPRPKSPPKGMLPAPEEIKKDEGSVPTLWPAWVYCTRYSDRPSSGKGFLVVEGLMGLGLGTPSPRGSNVYPPICTERINNK
jgi:hypothetical protein